MSQIAATILALTVVAVVLTANYMNLQKDVITVVMRVQKRAVAGIDNRELRRADETTLVEARRPMMPMMPMKLRGLDEFGSTIGSIPAQTPDTQLVPNTRTEDHQSSGSDLDNDEGLWIHIIHWREGIAGWTTSFAELFVMARALNATLVEPCIQRGRLVACHEDSTTKFTDIFNHSQILDFYPKFALYSEFEEKVAKKKKHPIPTFGVCIQKTGAIKAICENDEVFKAPNQTTSIALQDAMATVHSNDNIGASGGAILTVKNFWKSSFNQLHYNSRRLIDESSVNIMKNNHLQFVSSIETMADHYLNKMGIPPDSNFAVIHWRAELPDMDYMACAEAIIESKKVMNATGDVSGFVLMSSIGKHKNLMWQGASQMSKKTKAKKALKLLQQAGLSKIDSVFEDKRELQDMLFLVAIDLIVAAKAAKFATCADEEAQACSLCSKCNHISKFSKHALAYRGSHGGDGNGLECWPA